MSDEERPAPRKFAPPKIGLGDGVVWRHTRDDGEDAAAVVVQVGTGGALGLMVYPPGGARAIPKDGVLHIDDPRNRGRMTESGVWRRTDRDLRLICAIQAVADHVDLAVADQELISNL